MGRLLLRFWAVPVFTEVIVAAGHVSIEQMVHLGHSDIGELLRMPVLR